MLAPLRVMGLGGAFAAYAEGVDALASNAASPAVREPFSVAWYDYDYSVSLAFPAALRGTDFDNDGKVGFAYDNFVFYTLGGLLQIGPIGVGVLGDFQRYDLSPNAGASDLRVTETLGRVHGVVGVSLFGGQMAVGAGIRAVTLSLDSTTSSSAASLTIIDARKSSLTMDGVGPQIGVLIRPDDQPWRIGATYRAKVEGTPTEKLFGIVGGGAATDVPFAIPGSVRLPWEVEAGFVIQVGPRPLNPKWLDPKRQRAQLRQQIAEDRAARQRAQEAELRGIADPSEMYARASELARQEMYVRREEQARLEQADAQLLLERKARYWNWPRERITVLGEVLVTGPSRDAIGLESFFSEQSQPTGQPQQSGALTSVSPRLGLEGEPVSDLLQMRIGTYVEPSRFRGVVARQHFTFGLDVRLGAWSVFGIAGDQVWRISAMTDLAPRYENFGVSVGAWH